MMLRIQNERMSGNLFPSVREYFRFFGLPGNDCQRQRRAGRIRGR